MVLRGWAPDIISESTDFTGQYDILVQGALEVAGNSLVWWGTRGSVGTVFLLLPNPQTNPHPNPQWGSSTARFNMYFPQVWALTFIPVEAMLVFLLFFYRHPDMQKWSQDYNCLLMKLIAEHIYATDCFGGVHNLSLEDYYRVNPIWSKLDYCHSAWCLTRSLEIIWSIIDKSIMLTSLGLIRRFLAGCYIQSTISCRYWYILWQC